MPQLDTKALSFEVAGTLNRALTPLLERMATIEARMGPLSDVRDRLVVVETKCCAMPVGPDATVEQRLMSALDRLSTLEYALNRAEGHEALIADLKARLAAAEAVSVQYAELAATARQLIERVAVIEAKSLSSSPVTEGTLVNIDHRIKALEQKSAPEPVAADVAAVRDRLAALESKTDVLTTRVDAPHPLGLLVDKAERTIGELTKDVGALRERVAVVEVRQPMAGPQGPAGKDGTNGRDGKDGADGVTLGELAMVPGDDERQIKFCAMRDGVQVKDFGTVRIPAPAYQDVWVEGQVYNRGDLVTWAGSVFHCNANGVTSKPEESKAWRLMVKRGRDGRDGKDAPGALPVVSVSQGRG